MAEFSNSKLSKKLNDKLKADEGKGKKHAAAQEEPEKKKHA